MREIRMVDLKAQHERIKIEIEHAIQEVIETTSFINGPAVKSFQAALEKYLPVKHAIPCGNGTDALQLSLMALNLSDGDEVITPNFTFVATSEVVALMGLKPVLVDVDPDTFNISVEQLKRSISSRTRAIVPVHLFGQCAPMEEIMEIAREKKLYIIEDAAQAFGTEYTFQDQAIIKAGCMGEIGCTSFFPSKNLGGYGDGGACFTNSDELAGRIRSVANHGMGLKYHYRDVGINSRLDSIQAAILGVKLKYLDQFNHARQKAAEVYDDAFSDNPNLLIPSRTKNSTHIFHQYTLRTKGIPRDDLRKYLDEKGVPTMVYYPIPIHLQEGYKFLGYRKGDFPVSEKLCEEVISLPMHTEFDEGQQAKIIEAVLSYF